MDDRPPFSWNPLIALAEQAGDAILKVYATDFVVAIKDDASPVTEADKAAHQCIVRGLQRLTPTIPVLSEESDPVPFQIRRHWNHYWLVDPLDGTREFIRRNDEFSVNIALVADQRALWGLIYAPVSRVVYYGGVGTGAYRRCGTGPARPIRVRSPAKAPIRVAGSRSRGGTKLQRFLDRLGDYQLIPMGSSLKSCLVAEGEADVYLRFGPTSEWDTAAAQAVVEAAGGRITDLGFRPLRYNTRDSLLNPDFIVYGDRSMDWASYLRENG